MTEYQDTLLVARTPAIAVDLGGNSGTIFSDLMALLLFISLNFVGDRLDWLLGAMEG